MNNFGLWPTFWLSLGTMQAKLPSTRASELKFTTIVTSYVFTNLFLKVKFSVSQLAKVKVAYINAHKKWYQAAMNMKHALKESLFFILSEYFNVSKLRSGPKWPFFSNPLTYIGRKDNHCSISVSHVYHKNIPINVFFNLC